MYPIQNNIAAKTAEFMAIGQLLDEVNGPRIAMDVLQRGGSKHDLVRRLADANKDAPFTQIADAALGLSGPASGAYSLTRALNAAVERDWSRAPLESDLSDVLTTHSKQAPNGFYVPYAQMARDFNLGTAGQAGNLVGNAIATKYIRDPLRNLSALGRLGAQFIYGLTTTENLPRLAESTSQPNEGPPQFESEVSTCVSAFVESFAVPLTPKRIATQLTLSRQSLVQGTPGLDALLSKHLTRELLKQVEAAALSTADGTGDSPVGLLAAPGVPLLVGGTNGAALSLPHINALESYPSLQPGNANESIDYSGFLLNPQTRLYLRQPDVSSTSPFVGRDLLGYKTEVSNYMPSELAKGTSTDCQALAFSADWSEMIVAFYGPGIDVLVDRVTLASQGKVKITASAYVAVGVNNPGSFAIMKDARLVA